jgi:hypothetical protein
MEESIVSHDEKMTELRDSVKREIREIKGENMKMKDDLMHLVRHIKLR